MKIKKQLDICYVCDKSYEEFESRYPDEIFDTKFGRKLTTYGQNLLESIYKQNSKICICTGEISVCLECLINFIENPAINEIDFG